MTSRRRLLQIIASSFKWIAHSFTNIYYSLIPTAINDKNVKEKAQVVKVYGNSEVKNQLAPVLFDSVQQSVTFTTSNNGRKVVLSGTSSGYFIYTLSFGTTLPTNSVVLVSIKVKNPNNVFFGYRLRQNNITPMDYYGSTYIQVRTITSAIDCIQFYGNPNIDYTGVEIEDVQLVCLTQRFPFNTPTTLTDPRVQKILNGGYEEYNLGEIVDVDMSEIDSEPYNLFDGNLEIGFWDGNVGSQITKNGYASDIRGATRIKVVGGRSYTLEWNTTLYPNLYPYIIEVDENNIVLRRSNGSQGAVYTKQLLDETKYVYIYFFYQSHTFDTVPTDLICCFHIKGSRTGYADHNDFVGLANFKPTDVMGTKDTFLASSVGYKITKKTVIVDLGTLNYVLDDYRVYTTDLQNLIKKEAGLMNIICSSFVAVSSLSQLTSDNSSMYVSSAGNVSFSNMGYNATTFKQAMSGVLLYFELATYQTINVPLRHLGMAKIRDLSWSYNSGGAYLYATVNNIKLLTSDSIILNAYISKYMNVNYNNFYSNPQNNTLSQSANSNLIRVKDNQYDNVTDFINAMGDEYIYFETADVVDEIGIIIDKGNLSFSYQGAGVGTAHDTMEQTDTEWVFTKNITEDNLSNYAFYYADSTKFLYTTKELNGCRTDSIWSPNALTNISGYKLVDSNKLSDNDVACTIYAGKFYIRNDALTEQQLNDIIANKTIKYQLATPQVIRIPKKHLMIAKIRDLSWTYSSTTFRFASNISNAKPTADNETLANIYCAPFMTKTYSQTLNENLSISLDRVSYCYIKDTSISTINDLLSKYGDYYIFYETQDEVADIDLTILVEAGGTLTSNWFSWVKNQKCKDNFGSTTTYWTKNRLTQKNDNNVGLFLVNSNAYNYVGFYHQSSTDFKKNHKYLFSIKARKTSGNATTISLGWQNNTEVVITNNAQTNVWYECSAIFTQTRDDGTNTNAMGTTFYYGSTSDIVVGTDSYEAKEPMLIDLTVGFGAGKEPTDINDPVIKEILRLGYIPTDVSGTLTNIESKVLPNIGFKIKCK